MEMFFKLWKELPSCWRTLAQYFLVFKNFALLGHHHRNYLIKKGYIVLIHDLIHKIRRREKKLKVCFILFFLLLLFIFKYLF